MQPPPMPSLTNDLLRAQPEIPNIASATSVLQQAGPGNVNSGTGFLNKKSDFVNTAASSSSGTSSGSSNSVLSSGGGLSVQSAASSSSSSSSSSSTSKKSTSTKTVTKVSTAIGQQGPISSGASTISQQKKPPPVGSITVQRGPGGVSTITLTDGQGEPVVLKASGPVKIERIITPAGKIQFLINPITPPGEMEQEFEAEEVVPASTTTVSETEGTTTQRTVTTTTKPKVPKRPRTAKPFIPTTTSFPLPWTTTKRPTPPLQQAADLHKPPQVPMFEQVLNQITELANRISNEAHGTGTEVNASKTATGINSNTGISTLNTNTSNALATDPFLSDSNILSNKFNLNPAVSNIRPTIKQTVLNPARGTIPISRTVVNSVTGDAGPVLDSGTSRMSSVKGNRANSADMKSARTLQSLPTDHVHMHGEPHFHGHSHGPFMQDHPKALQHLQGTKQVQTNTVDSINSVVPGHQHGPQPPYEIKAHSQNSVPS